MAAPDQQHPSAPAHRLSQLGKVFLGRLLLWVILGAAVVFVCWWNMIRMPLNSYDGPWEPLSAEEEALRTELKSTVFTLADEIGDRNIHAYDNYMAAADFIENALQEAGYEVTRYDYEVEGLTCYNLEAELEGNSRPEEILVLGAHYDSVFGTPAANDNASGVAALLAIARRLADSQPDRTIRFVAFANEEPPFYRTEDMGSLHYARLCREREDNIIAMISLETIGYYSDEPGSQRYPGPFRPFYPSTGNFLAFVGNTSSRQLVRESIKAFRTHANFPSEGAALPGFIPGIGWSDHWAFWQEGYPAIMVTDTAPFRYPYYHSVNDTPDKLNYPHMARAVKGLLAMTRELANSP